MKSCQFIGSLVPDNAIDENTPSELDGLRVILPDEASSNKFSETAGK